MRLLVLQEQQVGTPHNLSPEELGELQKGFERLERLDIRRSCNSDSLYTLNPGCWVGTIQLPSLVVRVLPKLPVERVIFLWSYGLNPKRWREERPTFGEERDLAEAMAHAFKLALDGALRRGVLEHYRLREESSKTVRGRILMREQWANNLRLRNEVVVAYDDFTSDILENRLLKAALERIGRIHIRDDKTRQALFRYERLLGDVANEYYAPGRIPDVHFTPVNRHYDHAIQLARMILSAVSFELGDGSTRACGFLINMNDVFEKFVRVALREALHVLPGEFGKRELTFDEAREVKIEPDLLWSPHGTNAFVGDAKYKRSSYDDVPNADLYQMLAYVVAAGLQSGMLIYPHSAEVRETSLRIVHVGRTIEICAVDIEAEPRSILNSVGRIAERVRAMAQQHDHRAKATGSDALGAVSSIG